MKYIAILVFIIISIYTGARNEKFYCKDNRFSLPDSTIVTQILSLPLHSYIGKPLDSLLQALPAKFSNRLFMFLHLGYTRGVVQDYFTSEFNNCFVQIYIDTFRFLPIPNRTINWDMELAKKETIAFIKVYKNDYTCLYGCDNPKYYFP